MCRFLIVDDDSLLRECVKAMLAPLGNEVVEAKDGLEALMVFQALPGEIPVIIMDINMPRMDGMAATSVIKAAAPATRIILYSGCHQALPPDVPADAFLAKPFHSRELLSLVQRFLGEKNPADHIA